MPMKLNAKSLLSSMNGVARRAQSPMGPRQPVKRSLFGAVDINQRLEQTQWLDARLQEIAAASKHKWNFDFPANAPSDGPWQWTPMNSKELPDFYSPVHHVEPAPRRPVVRHTPTTSRYNGHELPPTPVSIVAATSVMPCTETLNAAPSSTASPTVARHSQSPGHITDHFTLRKRRRSSPPIEDEWTNDGDDECATSTPGRPLAKVARKRLADTFEGHTPEDEAQ